jgi:hypothetical protein
LTFILAQAAAFDRPLLAQSGHPKCRLRWDGRRPNLSFEWPSKGSKGKVDNVRLREAVALSNASRGVVGFVISETRIAVTAIWLIGSDVRRLVESCALLADLGGSSITSFKRSPFAMRTTKLSLPSCFIKPPARALPSAAFSAMRTASDNSCSTDFKAMMLPRSSRSNSRSDDEISFSVTPPVFASMTFSQIRSFLTVRTR